MLQRVIRVKSKYIYWAEAMSEGEWNKMKRDPKWLEAYLAQGKLNPDDVYIME